MILDMRPQAAAGTEVLRYGKNQAFETDLEVHLDAEGATVWMVDLEGNSPFKLTPIECVEIGEALAKHGRLRGANRPDRITEAFTQAALFIHARYGFMPVQMEGRAYAVTFAMGMLAMERLSDAGRDEVVKEAMTLQAEIEENELRALLAGGVSVPDLSALDDVPLVVALHEAE